MPDNVRRLHGGGEQLDDVSVYDRAERNVFVCNRTNCDVNATRLAEWPLRYARKRRHARWLHLRGLCVWCLL